MLYAEEQAGLKQQFANVDIVEANERVVLLSPFTPSDSSNRWTQPQLDADVQEMWCVPFEKKRVGGLGGGGGREGSGERQELGSFQPTHCLLGWLQSWQSELLYRPLVCR